MAFAELGLNEQEVFNLPPFRTYLMQMRYNREIEKRWEQTRQIMRMQHNTGQGVKNPIRQKNIIQLSFDEKDSPYPACTKEEAEELIGKWTKPD